MQQALALDLEAATPLEFLESSWARAYFPASWSSDEVRALKQAASVEPDIRKGCPAAFLIHE